MRIIVWASPGVAYVLVLPCIWLVTSFYLGANGGHNSPVPAVGLPIGTAAAVHGVLLLRTPGHVHLIASDLRYLTVLGVVAMTGALSVFYAPADAVSMGWLLLAMGAGALFAVLMWPMVGVLRARAMHRQEELTQWLLEDERTEGP